MKGQHALELGIEDFRDLGYVPSLDKRTQEVIENLLVRDKRTLGSFCFRGSGRCTHISLQYSCHRLAGQIGILLVSLARGRSGVSGIPTGGSFGYFPESKKGRDHASNLLLPLEPDFRMLVKGITVFGFLEELTARGFKMDSGIGGLCPWACENSRHWKNGNLNHIPGALPDAGSRFSLLRIPGVIQ